jgi:hypothetical protein
MVNMDTVYTRAKAMIDEQEDDVKEMNRMILFIKTLQIRDQQLKENQIMEQEYLQD